MNKCSNKQFILLMFVSIFLISLFNNSREGFRMHRNKVILNCSDFKDSNSLKSFSHNIVKRQIKPWYKYKDYKDAQLKALDGDKDGIFCEKYPSKYNANGIGKIY